MIGKITTMSLSHEQKRILKLHAGSLLEFMLGVPTPLWSTVGDDVRKEVHQQLLVRLRETQNTGIAVIIEEHPEVARLCLLEKVRSMRHLQRKKSKCLTWTISYCPGLIKRIYRFAGAAAPIPYLRSYRQ